MELRCYQQRILDKTRQKLRTHRRPVIVAPTGSGKTHIAAHIVAGCQENHARTLFLAPRRELIYQAADKFQAMGIESGMIMAGEAQRVYSRHQIASFDTLHARAMRKDKMVMPAADVVIVDEAHLSESPAKKAILEHYGDKIIIGLTATPCGSDSGGLGKTYDSLINEVSVRELMDEGHLVDVDYYAPTIWDTKDVKRTKSDFVVSSLAKAVDKPKLIGDIYENWKRIAPDKSTVIFCTNRSHSRHVRDSFLARGIRAEHVDGETGIEERAAIFERVRNRATQVLCNVYVASYGLDIPELECAVLARPTKSLRLYIQTGGRMLRPYDGKSRACLIDHTGAIQEHGYLDDSVPWTLTPKSDIRKLKKKQDERRGALKEIRCNECGTVFKGQRNCPACHFELIPPTKDIPTKAAELELVNKTEPRFFYAMLRGYAIEKGYKPGWAKHQYHKKFKSWPQTGGAPMYPNAEVRAYVKSRNITYHMGRKSR